MGFHRSKGCQNIGLCVGVLTSQHLPDTGPADTGDLFDGVQLGGDARQLVDLSAHPLTIGVVVPPSTPLVMPDPCPPFSGRASTSLPVHHQHELFGGNGGGVTKTSSSSGGDPIGSRVPPGVWFGTALVDLFGVDGGLSTSTHDEVVDAELAIVRSLCISA